MNSSFLDLRRYCVVFCGVIVLLGTDVVLKVSINRIEM